MALFHWRPRYARKPAKKTIPPCVEALEERDCPTLTIGLSTAEDTGPSNTDKYTSFTTPTLQGTTTDPFASAGVIGVFMSTDGGDPVFKGLITLAPNGTDWTFPITTPLEAGHVYKFAAIDGFLQEGNQNPDVVVDTVENAPTSLVLASDSGVAGDGITNDTTPTITG